jgi:2-dehydro-3-deoxyphosphogluconate aldolase/(4S)-4-hydroxy-2-oxoglutarate aldolase
MALEHNIEVVKFFPAETLGGVNALKAFSGPYGNVRFIPTGGISASNLSNYLALPSVLACGGSWMVKADDWDQTTHLTAEALEMVNKF